MSIDINWDTLTSGADGSDRTEAIRAFIDDKFQQVTLPRFIRSVHVHSFDFGRVPPEIEIKDICDPLPDFYEEDEDYLDEDVDGLQALEQQEHLAHGNDDSGRSSHLDAKNRGQKLADASKVKPQADFSRLGSPFSHPHIAGLRPAFIPHENIASPFMGGTTTPGISGGTSNMNYFHLPLSAGLSGAATPLAAVAGARIQAWPDHGMIRPSTPANARLRHAASTNSLTLTPQSNPDPGTRPSSRHQHDPVQANSRASSAGRSSNGDYHRASSASSVFMQQKSPEDLQIVAHVQYAGDVRMSLTAEILLDFPVPSFVGIPLTLNITGLTFDGVAILAHIRKRAHFCFLSPDDADTLVNDMPSLDALNSESRQSTQHPRIGSLLEHIKVESEIGDRENGKQVLKNVGKVETFVLEQVRRIFEDEFVYPNFWTFLV